MRRLLLVLVLAGCSKPTSGPIVDDFECIGSIVEARALFLDWHQVAVIHHGPPLRVLVPRRFDTVRVNSLPCSPTHGRASGESATGRRIPGAG